jgi:4-amino-4-deoxy-L-arabinose transferase-like glycosyltransferase
VWLPSAMTSAGALFVPPEETVTTIGDQMNTHRIYLPSSILIFILALVIRVGLAAAFVGLEAPPDARANPDQLDYELFAWRMSQGEGFTLEDGTPTARRPPGTSLALLPVYALVGRSFAAGRLWFCLLSAATCLIVAWVGRDAFDPLTGLVAALWLAVYPNHAYYAMHFLSEVPFSLLVVAATGATIRAFRDEVPLGWAGAAGLSWGLAGLVRPNILLVIPLFWLILLLRARGKWGLVRRLAVMTALVCITVSPWVVRNRLVMGRPMLSTVHSYTFWGAHNHRILERRPGGWIEEAELIDRDHPLNGDELTRADLMWDYSQEFLTRNYRWIPYLTVMKLYRLLSPFSETPNRVVYWTFAVSWVMAAVWLIPGFFIAWRIDRLSTYLLASPLLAMVGTAMLYYGSIRFRDSVAPLYLLFGALGLVKSISRLIGSSVTSKGQSQISPGKPTYSI